MSNSNDPRSLTGFGQLQKHPQYYIKGADLRFLVGKQLFRVHRYFFERESRIFREHLLPEAESRGAPGDSDSHAVVLPTTAENFEKLLGVFYNPKYNIYDWSTEHWTTILSLASEWEFEEVKSLAVRELETKEDITVIERIVLYQKYNVGLERLVPLYGILSSQDDALTEKESEALGMKTTVIIFRARERLRALPSNEGRSPLPKGMKEEQIQETIMGIIGVPPTSPTKKKTGSSGNTANQNGTGTKDQKDQKDQKDPKDPKDTKKPKIT